VQCLVVAHSRSTGVLVVTTNPFFLPFVLLASRPLHRRRVIALIYDLYPDALAMTPGRRPPRVLSALAGAMNRTVFSRADHVVFIGDAMAAHAMEQYGRPPRFDIIETGASLSELADAPALDGEPTALDEFCRGRIVASYVGNMGHAHDVDTIAAVLPGWLEEGHGKRALVIAASGPGVAVLREALRKVPPDLFRIVDPLDDAAWVALLRASAISIVTLKSAAWGTSIPSKLFSAMAAGNAIMAVAPPRSDLARIVRDSGCGQVAAPGDAGEATNALSVLSSANALQQARAQATRTAAEYDMGRLARRWQRLLGGAPPTPSASEP
jgi:colanic acid biosynthesis glycosyl transferase WcaI